jgi:hypothetical protein
MNQLGDYSLTSTAPLLAALATMAAVLVALFRDSILLWWRRPKLKAWVNLNPPHCHATEMEFADGVRHPVYWFMLWVGNQGRGRAEKVQVFADKLEREGADGWFHRVQKFMPMNLRWSHGGGTFLDGISPRMGQHCNLGCVGHPSVPGRPASVSVPKVWFALDTELKSFTNSHLLEPGKYKLRLRIAAANAKPINLTIGLTITGEWFDQESEMFSKGIGLRICH